MNVVGPAVPGAAASDPAVPEWATLVRAPNPGPMTLDGTNTWVLRAAGAASCIVVDPGPRIPAHLEAVAAHGPVAVTLLTHGHPDHAEGAREFAAMTGSDVLAVDRRHVVGGRLLTAGVEPLHAAGLRVDVLATPGHTADSVCFLVTEEAPHRPGSGAGAAAAVLTGDTILGRGTTVVAWPEGRLGDYLRSLERIRGLGPVPALPGHGPVLPDAGAAAHAYLEHRAARLDQVRAVVAAGARTPAEVVARVYADVDPALWPAAELSVRAQLEYLDALDGPPPAPGPAPVPAPGPGPGPGPGSVETPDGYHRPQAPRLPGSGGPEGLA